jgi:hypothetical protein
MPKMIFKGNVNPSDRPRYSEGDASGMASFSAAGTAI